MSHRKARAMLFQRRREIESLKATLHELQCFVSDYISVNTTQSYGFPGNPYPTYEAQVTELDLKYRGQSRWGAQAVKNLVDTRTAFMVGDGVMVNAADDTADVSKEIAFIRDFLRRNNLDREGVQDWAREAELEGKFLCRLVHDPKAKQIDARFVSWALHGYSITTDPQDYAKYAGASYRVAKNGDEVRLTPPEFIYKKFGGRTSQVNDTPPKLGVLLWDIESLHKALYDWRQANRYFGTPTPHFKAATAQEAQSLHEKLKQLQWKIGQFIVSTAEFSLVGIPADGIASLEKEIITHAKVISGGSGVPVHFLGFPELMSNRATADNLMEAVFSATSRERNIWIGAYNELFEKVLAMANAVFGFTFNTKAVKATIAEMSATRIAQLVSLWLPLRQEEMISRQTFLEHIPDVDPDQEARRLDEEDASSAQKAAEAFKGGLGINRPAPPKIDPAAAKPDVEDDAA